MGSVNALLNAVACPADLDGSGDVGFSDILQIIGAWGPCGVPFPKTSAATVAWTSQTSSC